MRISQIPSVGIQLEAFRRVGQRRVIGYCAMANAPTFPAVVVASRSASGEGRIGRTAGQSTTARRLILLLDTQATVREDTGFGLLSLASDPKMLVWGSLET